MVESIPPLNKTAVLARPLSALWVFQVSNPYPSVGARTDCLELVYL